MKYLVLGLLATLAVESHSARHPVQTTARGKPNLLLFVTDDQRADFLGCAGHPVLRTPVVDRLARRGVRFENAFASTPICAASRASIFTGTWERRHGTTFGTPPLPRALVAESYPVLLRQAGYRTGFVGKFGVRTEDGATGEMFDVYEPRWQPFQKELPDGRTRHLTDLAGDAALEFLRGCRKKQPFCLSVSFNAPHAEDANKQVQFPTSPAEAGLYTDCEIAPPRVSTDFWRELPEFFATSLHRERWFWRWDTPQKYDRNVRAYYRMISGIDRVIGRILAELERRGLAENTVVLFTSDNGYYKGSRGFAGKWSHYEESLRVPLVIHDPRLEPGVGNRVLSPLVLNVDLYATLLDLAGIELPGGARGRSLMPFVRGETPSTWRRDFLFEHLFEHEKIPRMEGVRGERHVYARYVDHLPEGEFLHDLEGDPLQLVNLAIDPERHALLTEMRARCDELVTQMARTGPR